MTAISKVQAVWTGFLGAPGVSTFYLNTTDVDTAPFTAFFDAMEAIFPPDVHIRLESSGATVSMETGDLLGGWTDEVLTESVGSGADIFSAASGAGVQWLTDDFVDSRRVRGRTFLVPISSSLYDGDGNVSETARDIIDDAASALVGTVGAELVVWHRPKPGVNGSVHSIVSGRALTRPVILRSRRD